MNEWMSTCMLCLKYRVYRGCHCWHHVSAVHFLHIKPYNQYVLLAPCTVILCLLQTLVHFSSFGFRTYILFCVTIQRFPSFIDLLQIVVCCYDIWYDMVWYDMIWYDMIWYDMIWYDMIWYGMIWYGMVWYDMIWYDMIWYMVWYVLVCT